MWQRLVVLGFLLLTVSLAQAATTPTSDFTDNGDGTVTHKVTGLTWKRCSEGQAWSGSTCTGTAKTYTWSDANTLTSGGWRLPSIAELVTIVERDNVMPAINTMIFPNTPTSAVFWSASTTVLCQACVWYVGFSNGASNSYSKTDSNYVRLVRGGQPLDSSGLYTPSSDFSDNGDGSVTDKKTNLIWKRCAEGQSWTGSTCSGTARTYDWSEANALSTSNWRLPSQNELLTIVEWGKSKPAINATIFPNTPSFYFWSASALATISNYAWAASFSYGEGYDHYKTDRDSVRLVRSGQPVSSTTGSVSGFITDSNGTPLGGVVVDNGTFSSTCLSDVMGKFTCNYSRGSSGKFVFMLPGYVFTPSSIAYIALSSGNSVQVAAKKLTPPAVDTATEDPSCRWTNANTAKLMYMSNPNCAQKQGYSLYLRQGRMQLNLQAAIWAAGFQKLDDSIATGSKAIDFVGALGSFGGMGLSVSEGKYLDVVFDASFDSFDNILALAGLSTDPASDDYPIAISLTSTAIQDIKATLKNVADGFGDAVVSAASFAPNVGKIALYVGGTYGAEKYAEKLNNIYIAGLYLEDYYKSGMYLPDVINKYGASQDGSDLIDKIAIQKGLSNSVLDKQYDVKSIQAIVGAIKDQVIAPIISGQFQATASGALSSFKFSINISPSLQDLNKEENIYVLLVPPNPGKPSFLINEGTGFSEFDAKAADLGAKPFTRRTLSGSTDVLITNGIDVSGIAGSAIFVGYGADVADFVNGRKYKLVYTIPFVDYEWNAVGLK
ncbi:MAG: Lcl C-terminal domain-containing protein [Victivallaceae bacterium]